MLLLISVALMPVDCPCVRVCCNVASVEEMLAVELIAVPTTCEENDSPSCTAVSPAICPSIAWVME